MADEPNGPVEPEDAVTEPSGDELGEELIDPESFEIPEEELAVEAEELADTSEDDTEPVADEEQLDEATELARQAVSTRPAKRERANAPVKKGTPTRKRDVKPEDEGGTGPITFVKQSVEELRKTVWPSGDDVKQYFVVVLVFVLFMMVVVAGFDYLFGWGLLKWLG
ncbi:MAG: preprotein translocase subunit SecE [Propionibacteriaceae bacterium]|nr:preprotein translocase subunit SecE [Propionibacteriaceae bacterium]